MSRLLDYYCVLIPRIFSGNIIRPPHMNFHQKKTLVTDISSQISMFCLVSLVVIYRDQLSRILCFWWIHHACNICHWKHSTFASELSPGNELYCCISPLLSHSIILDILIDSLQDSMGSDDNVKWPPTIYGTDAPQHRKGRKNVD